MRRFISEFDNILTMNKKCIICGTEFQTNYPRKKTCSEECSGENHKRYSRNYYHTEEGHRNVLRAVKKYNEKNREKIKDYRKKYKHKYHTSKLTAKQMEKLKNLAERQQIMDDYNYEEYGICPICEKKKKLIEHHISYDPIERIFMCYSCHAILHHCLLHRKKCKAKRQKNIP